MHETEQPKLVKDPDDKFGSKYHHPAFGCISASRVTGCIKLAGSELEHNHYVVVRIGETALYRQFSEDRFSDKNGRGFVEVAMSEMQWAQFISSMNIGSGATCTIQYRPEDIQKLARMPKLEIESRHSLAKKEIKENGDAIGKDLKEAISSLEALLKKTGSVSKKELGDIISSLRVSVQDVVSNLPFYVDQHTEVMEKNVSSAKADIEGFILGTLTAMGIDTLKNNTPTLIEEK